MKYISKHTLLGYMVFLSGLLGCGDSVKGTKGPNDEDAETGLLKKGSGSAEVMFTARQYDALQMKVDTLAQRNMSGYVEANGRLEVPPQNEATITSIIGANVVSIEVIEGDKVLKNQVVAYLSHPNIIQKQTDYLNAHSTEQFLKKEYERQKKLYEAGVGSGMAFQKAEADYKVAKAMASGLEAQLRQFNINTSGVRNGTIYQRVALLSPIEGFVQKVQVRTGQYVEPQTDLFEIVNTHHVHADLMVFEKDVNKVREGQKVRFQVQSIPGNEMSAEIYSVSKSFEEGPKAVHVHAEIENKEGNLIPGMYIQGRIEVEKTKTLAIPESAIAQDGGRSFVFTAEKEGGDWSFRPLEITTGTRDGYWVAINLVEPGQTNQKFAFNNAYYLMAEMKKGEAEHDH
ncbi:MAG: efflux RND transporter periplasmic adaptor subunit [Sediminicola sp.]